MIYRIVHMEFESGSLKEFIEIFHESKDYILSFEACHDVFLMKDERNANAMATWSVWESESKLDEYRSSERFKKTWKRVKSLLVSKPRAYSFSKWKVDETN